MMIYQLSIFYQIKSARDGLIGILVLVLLVFILDKPSYDSSLEIIFLSFSVPLILFWSPQFFMHVQYLLKSAGLKLEINTTRQLLSIISKSKTVTYSYNDVGYIEFNRPILDKDRIVNKGRWVANWSGYSYIKIRFNDGTIFFLTSLMGDLNAFPLQPFQTRFRLFPFIQVREYNYRKMKSIVEEMKIEKVKEYRSRFEHYETEELKKFLIDSNKYDLAAVQAAKELIESRNAG